MPPPHTARRIAINGHRMEMDALAAFARRAAVLIRTGADLLPVLAGAGAGLGAEVR